MPLKKYYKPVPYDRRRMPHDVGAVRWIKMHPEDIPMARENLAARDKGFDDDGVRKLFAAISLRACADYRNAHMANYVAGKEPSRVMSECQKFFQGDIFQFFIDRMDIDVVKQLIKEDPNGILERYEIEIE